MKIYQKMKERMIDVYVAVMLILGLVFFVAFFGCEGTLNLLTNSTPTYREAQADFDYWKGLHSEICAEPTPADMQAKCTKYGKGLDKIQNEVLNPWKTAIDLADGAQGDYELEFAKIKRKVGIILLRELMKD